MKYITVLLPILNNENEILRVLILKNKIFKRIYCSKVSINAVKRKTLHFVSLFLKWLENNDNMKQGKVD